MNDTGDRSEASILFADLSGFTALTEAHGDLDAVEIAKRFTELATTTLNGRSRLLKTMGDEAMILAPTPREAAMTALALAEAVEAEASFPAMRAGMHHGPVVHSGDDVFGATVNLASRVAAHARAGQILCTQQVAEALERSGIAVRPEGVERFRNISEPVSLFALPPTGSSPTIEIDPVCRMRIEPTEAQGRLNFADRTWWFCSLRCASAFATDPDRYRVEP